MSHRKAADLPPVDLGQALGMITSPGDVWDSRWVAEPPSRNMAGQPHQVGGRPDTGNHDAGLPVTGSHGEHFTGGFTDDGHRDTEHHGVDHHAMEQRDSFGFLDVAMPAPVTGLGNARHSSDHHPRTSQPQAGDPELSPWGIWQSGSSIQHDHESGIPLDDQGAESPATWDGWQFPATVTAAHTAGKYGTPGAPAFDVSSDQEPDWGIVVTLRTHIAELIRTEQEQWELNTRRRMSPEDRRLHGRSIIRRAVHDYAEELNTTGQALWTLALEQRYARAVEDAIFGYGRMQPVFDIPDAENIEIHGFDNVVAQFGDGTRQQLDPVADSDEELVAAVRFLGENADPPRPFDDAHPTITVALGNRFRLHAIGFGLADRPSVIIRQHLLTDISLEELARGGMMPDEVADVLRRSVLARKSIVISGDQGAGKTTLLRALVDAIPETERFGTLETDYELLTHLQPRRRNMVALQAKTGLGEIVNGRHIGEYTVADLIPEALRQNLSRLVVGEVRGNEAGAMLQAMQSGAGALTTTHSHSASSTMDRLAARVAEGGVLRLDEAYRQIAHNIHLLVHVTLIDDTWRGGARRRFISEIRLLTGAMESDRPTTHLVYRAQRDGNPEVFSPSQELLAELAPFAAQSPAPGGGAR